MKYISNDFHWFTARYMGRSGSFYGSVTGSKSDYLSLYVRHMYISVSVSTAFRKLIQSPPTGVAAVVVVLSVDSV